MSPDGLADNTGASKKRSRDEMMTNAAAGHGQAPVNLQFSGLSLHNNEGSTIEKLMTDLKERVLNGETLNNFKKEIAQISVLIDKSDNHLMFEKSVYYLA
jgi:hypothetical protein